VTETSSPTAALQALRARHVKERRRLAVDAQRTGATFGRDVMREQEIIEAIDRAITDEQRLAREELAAPEPT
jgi:hypothetical protein